MIEYIIIAILAVILIYLAVKFYQYKEIVDQELGFYEERLSEEVSKRKGVVLEYESKKHLLENPHPEDFEKVDNKDIKKDLDQRTDNIYDYLTKISNQIDYLHYHQLNIPKIESKRLKSNLLTLEEHHNYIEYILQSHNIKSEIDYFNHSLIAPEKKILPFAFFVKLKEKHLIIDTKLFHFIIELKRNIENIGDDKANQILSERINKYFNYISNPKYLENIKSYFTARKIINVNDVINIIAILPTMQELNIINSVIGQNVKSNLQLIDSGNLYQFLS